MTDIKSIWSTLSKVDVSNKTEKKGNLTYLSWAWAWGVMMEHYPQANYKFDDPMVFNDGSMMVFVTVTIDDISRDMWLPVLNYKNQAIENPSAMDINTARMRCLTKCLAMFGLGHYIYAGEDLPAAVKQENGLKTILWGKFLKAIKDDNPLLMYEVSQEMNEDWWNTSYNSFKENKTESKRNVDRLLSEGRKMWNDVITEYREHKQNDDELGMKQLREDLPEYFQSKLDEVA